MFILLVNREVEAAGAADGADAAIRSCRSCPGAEEAVRSCPALSKLVHGCRFPDPFGPEVQVQSCGWSRFGRRSRDSKLLERSRAVGAVLWLSELFWSWRMPWKFIDSQTGSRKNPTSWRIHTAPAARLRCRGPSRSATPSLWGSRSDYQSSKPNTYIILDLHFIEKRGSPSVSLALDQVREQVYS